VFCPRCNYRIELITEEKFVEYGTNNINSKKEYFCNNCTCVLVDCYNNFDFVSSDWIDFSG